jgi:polysaccharide deacetylase family protein (PEP-CTERM system associated)
MAWLLSVDLEEYFHANALAQSATVESWTSFPSRVAAQTARLLEEFSKRSVTATFFVLGWVAKRHPDLVQRIADEGHGIASHGWSHTRIPELDRAAFGEELRESKALLEDITGVEIRGFRAPCFSIIKGTEWAFDELLEAGYSYDSSLFPIARPNAGYQGSIPAPHRIERAGGELLELPLATARIGPLRIPVAGGAYLRHLPFRYSLLGLQAAHREHGTVMVYVHPWEIDPDQPRLDVGSLARIRHYRGLETMLGRIGRLCDVMEFQSVEKWLETVDPTTLPVS